MLIKILIACILSALCYRCGGMGKEDTAEPKWIPKWMRNTKARDLGCPTVMLIALWLMEGFKLPYWWVYLLTFGLNFAALTTYWDFMFGYDNFYMHGLMIGLAGIPLLWCGVPTPVVMLRIVICALGMGLWSKWIGNDVLEETGRGILFIL